MIHESHTNPSSIKTGCPFLGHTTAKVHAQSGCPFDLGIDPAIRFFNTADSLRAQTLSQSLHEIATCWSKRPTIDITSEHGEFVKPSWLALNRFLKALSATDYYIGCCDGQVLVERPGQRARGRGRELSEILKETHLNPNHLDWSRIEPPLRYSLACLMILALRGGALEEVNRVENVTQIPQIVAQSLALVEQLSARIIFDPSSNTFLNNISEFSKHEKSMLTEKELEKVTLVEGVRRALYVPKTRTKPDDTAMSRLCERAGLDADVFAHEPGRFKELLQRKPIEELISLALIDLWENFADEGFVTMRWSKAPLAHGDQLDAWAIVGGVVFRYPATISIDTSGLVSVVPQGRPEEVAQVSSWKDQLWRRNQEMLANLPPDTLESTKTIRAEVMFAEWALGHGERLLPDTTEAVRRAAHYLMRRLVDHNLPASANGTQLGATSVQQGWHLAYDSKEGAAGLHMVNNPAHARGGVQTMLRAPICHPPLSQIRVWRERGDAPAQYSLKDLPQFTAYQVWMEEALNEALEQRAYD